MGLQKISIKSQGVYAAAPTGMVQQLWKSQPQSRSPRRTSSSTQASLSQLPSFRSFPTCSAQSSVVAELAQLDLASGISGVEMVHMSNQSPDVHLSEHRQSVRLNCRWSDEAARASKHLSMVSKGEKWTGRVSLCFYPRHLSVIVQSLINSDWQSADGTAPRYSDAEVNSHEYWKVVRTEATTRVFQC